MERVFAVIDPSEGFSLTLKRALPFDYIPVKGSLSHPTSSARVSASIMLGRRGFRPVWLPAFSLNSTLNIALSSRLRISTHQWAGRGYRFWLRSQWIWRGPSHPYIPRADVVMSPLGA